jgi:hypothetical protein
MSKQKTNIQGNVDENFIEVYRFRHWVAFFRTKDKFPITEVKNVVL